MATGGAPAGFPNFDSWADMENLYRTIRPDGEDTSDFTFFDTQFTSHQDNANAMRKLGNARNEKEKAAIVSEFASEALRKMAPRQHQLWMLGETFWDVCSREIKKETYVPIVGHFRASANVSETPPDQLTEYGNASKAFRLNVRDVLPSAAWFGGGAVANVNFDVPRMLLGQVQDILASIIRKRNTKLKSVKREGRMINGEKVGAEHYEYYVGLIEDSGEALMPIWKRTKGNAGIPVPGEHTEMDSDGIVKMGYRLLSTALETHCRITGAKLGSFRTNKNADLVHAYREVVQMRENQKDSTNNISEYSQQCANIDTVFNFFLYLEGSRMLSDDDNFKYRLNNMLYVAGMKFVGKEKIKNLIESSGPRISPLLKYMNNTGSIHMPPFAITYRRIYDMVSIFGGLRMKGLAESMTKPGISPRYIVHLRPDKVVSMGFVCSLFVLEERAHEGDDILESEHMFHQMLLSKTCSYQNSIGKRGNIFNIHIRATGN